MPLLFAIVGVVALLLAALVLAAPVLLVVGIAKAIRSASRSRNQRELTPAPLLEALPFNACMTDSAFTDLIVRQWPEEATGLRAPHA